MQFGLWIRANERRPDLHEIDVREVKDSILGSSALRAARESERELLEAAALHQLVNLSRNLVVLNVELALDPQPSRGLLHVHWIGNADVRHRVVPLMAENHRDRVT